MYVVIPCFNRPEFLSVCLEQILKADQAEGQTYIFCKDHKFNKSIQSVIDDFPLQKYEINTPFCGNSFGQQSYNVLNGLLVAAKYSDKVCLVEDDIMISKDFFTWMNDILNNVECFCSIASFNHNTRHTCTENENGYYFGSETDYQGWGMAMTSKVIMKYIFPHFQNDYFQNSGGYVKTHFPESVISGSFTEQDGLIRRIMERQRELKPVFPHVPRAFHSGFYSYHRGASKHYTPEQIKRIIFDPVAFKRACGKYQDSEPCNMLTSHSTLEYVNV